MRSKTISADRVKEKRQQRAGHRSPAVVETLDSRLLMSVTLAGTKTATLSQAAATRGLAAPAPITVEEEVVPGGTIVRTTELHALPTQAKQLRQLKQLTQAPSGTQNLNGFDIVLKKGPNLLANPAASAAFDAAAAFFEAILSDPITVTIDAEVAPLGAGILGSTGSVGFTGGYTLIRDLVSNGRAGDGSEAIAAQLPTAAQFVGTLPSSPGNPYSFGGLQANRATLLALGVGAGDLPGDTSAYAPGVFIDMSMTFSSNFNFDYDRSNGIGAGLYDFVGVAIHEIGHGLGFTSSVDDVDFLQGHAGGRTIFPTPLDLYRVRSNFGGGGATFTSGARVLAPGNIVPTQVMYDGGFFNPAGITTPSGLLTGEIPFSTGTDFGDGQQASHWKDNVQDGGVQVGIMDPTAVGTGQQMNWQLNDTRALGLIGWDVDLTAPAASTFAHLFQTAPNKLQYTFNEDVRSSFTLADLSVQKVGGGVVSPASLTFNATGTVATVTFNGLLADGNYKSTILANGAGGGITDLSGNRLAANRVDDFFFLQGDINHDREVGAGDFNILATNFGLSGRTFAQGDLDLDGVVGPGDFNILATKFGTILAP